MKIPNVHKVMCALALLALLWASVAEAQPSRKTEEVGSWLLSCPQDPATDKTPCRLRHRVWVVAPQPGHPDAAMEVENRDGGPVPVLMVRGVTLPDTAGALVAHDSTADVQFDFEDALSFPCVFGHGALTCAPKPDEEKVAVARLRAAQVALVRLHLALPASATSAPLDQLRALDMNRTRDALRRIEPGAAVGSGWDWHDLLEWLLRQLGFPGGVAELRHWMADQVATLMSW